VIVVDEPMVGLDPKGARLIKDLLRTFVEQGGTVFLSTHTLEIAEALCDRIAILHEGRVRAVGTMDDLRREAAAGTAGLEEVFLKLTQAERVGEVVGLVTGGAGGLAGPSSPAPVQEEGERAAAPGPGVRAGGNGR